MFFLEKAAFFSDELNIQNKKIASQNVKLRNFPKQTLPKNSIFQQLLEQLITAIKQLLKLLILES